MVKHSIEQVDDTTYKTEVHDTIIEIGDSKQDTFRPGIKWINTLFNSNYGFA